MSQLSWEYLGTPLTELEEVDTEKPVWMSLLRLLPVRHTPRYNEYLTHYISNNSIFTSQARSCSVKLFHFSRFHEFA